MTFGLRTFGKRLAEGVPCGGGEQGLTAAGQRHDARGDRHGEAVDLGTYRAPSDVFRSVLAEASRARHAGPPGR